MKRFLIPSGILSLAYMMDVIQEIIIGKNFSFRYQVADIFWIIEIFLVILFIIVIEFGNKNYKS